MAEITMVPIEERHRNVAGNMVRFYEEGNRGLIPQMVANFERTQLAARDAEIERLRGALRLGAQYMRDVLAEYREAKETERPFVLALIEWEKSARAALADKLASVIREKLERKEGTER